MSVFPLCQRPHRILVLFILLWVLLFKTVYAHDNTSYMAQVTTSRGTYGFDLEIANTQEKKERGLMYRDTLDANKGMLFVFTPPAIASVWMKNTLISLDIIFINCQGKVTSFVTRLPQTLDISSSKEKICFFLEVNAGLIQKMGLKKGDSVNFVPKKLQP